MQDDRLCLCCRAVVSSRIMFKLNYLCPSSFSQLPIQCLEAIMEGKSLEAVNCQELMLPPYINMLTKNDRMASTFCKGISIRPSKKL